MTILARTLKNRPNLKFRAPGLKASLVGAILVTISATSALVYFPWALISKRNVDTIVTQANEEIVLGASQEVRRLFNSAKVANQFLQNSVSYQLIDFENFNEREDFFLSLLKANPNFSWVQFGYPSGDFFGAQRLPQGELKTHFRDWDESTQSSQTTIKSYRSNDLGQEELIHRKTSALEPPFYAPQRPWYQSAIAQPGQMSWTVYVYHSTKTPGMDVSVTVDATDQQAGVVGVGIELSQLSEFLTELQDSLAGEVFILNSNQEILASTASGTTLSRKQSAELPRLAEAQNPLLRHAHAAITQAGNQVSPGGRLTYTDPDTGEVFFIALNPLEDLDWMVGTVIPAEHFLKEIQQNRRQLLWVISLFILTTAGLAVFLSDHVIAKPILKVTSAAADIEAETFKPESLSGLAKRQDELGQLARVFNHMAQEVYVREKRLKKQVKELRIEIDEVKRHKQVTEIVESDFFQDLTAKANSLRQRSKNRRS